jgi:hypothetical protein
MFLSRSTKILYALVAVVLVINMGQDQRVADWGDRRLSGTIVPTCDRPIGDGPGREANVNGAGKEDGVNYKNNLLRQASKCAGDPGLCPECSRQQRLALHPFHSTDASNVVANLSKC